jgi:tetratricopeptide (TPR) repeat protein
MTYFSQFIIIFFIFINGAYSQKVSVEFIDSLIYDFDNYAEINSDGFNQLDEFANKICKLSRSINYKEGELSSYLLLAETYRDFSSDKTDLIMRKADSLVKIGVDMPSLIIRYNLIKGYLCGGQGEFLNELVYYLKADSVAKKNNIKDAQRYINQSILSYYIGNEDYEKALDLARVNMYDTEKERYSYFVDIENVGIIHSYVKNYDSAIFYFNKALKEGYGEYSDLHYLYFSIGRAYLDLNELDSSQKYLNIAKSISETSYQYTVDVVNVYNNLGMLFKKKKQIDSAVFFFNLGYETSDSLSYLHGKLSSSRGILEIKLQGSNLLKYFYVFEQTKDTILNRASKETEIRYLIENETLKKEAVIKELKLKKELDKNHRMLLYGIFSFLLLVSLFVIYRYILTQKILKKNLEIEEYKKQQAERDLLEKEKELASTINILQSNIKVIEELKVKEVENDNLSDITSVFEQNYISDTQWQNIIIQFETIHSNYLSDIKQEGIKFTINDTKILVLLKLGYSNQGISEILNISIDGVKKAKYRLKKKVVGEIF